MATAKFEQSLYKAFEVSQSAFAVAGNPITGGNVSKANNSATSNRPICGVEMKLGRAWAVQHLPR